MKKNKNNLLTIELIVFPLIILILTGCVNRRKITDPDYRVEEVARPTLEYHSPYKDAVNINRNTSVTLWFSELMDEVSVKNNFYLGPFAGMDSIQVIATTYNDSSEVYAGRYTDGIFKSSDNANNWNWITSENLRKTVNNIEISRTNSDVIYLATNSGVYKSSNAGNSWEKMNSGLTDLSILSIAVDPNDDNIIYVATSLEGVFKSENGGISWEAKNNGIRTGKPAYDIVINPNNSDVLFLATEGNFVLRSVDGAENWSRLRSGLSSRNYFCLAVHPLDSNLVYAGSAESGIYRSNNRGNGWIDISTNLSNLVINSIAVDPSDTNTVYIGTHAGLYKTSNAGRMSDGVSTAIWNSIGSSDWEGGEISSVVVHPLYDQLLFVSVLGDGIFKSIDGGTNWWKKTNLLIDKALEFGTLQFEIWQDSTTVFAPVDDSLEIDTTIIFPYVNERALEGWDGTGEPPVENNPEASKMIFTPNQSLLPNCEYRVKVKGKFKSDKKTLQSDPSAAMDLNGNSFEKDAGFIFRTTND